MLRIISDCLPYLIIATPAASILSDVAEHPIILDWWVQLVRLLHRLPTCQMVKNSATSSRIVCNLMMSMPGPLVPKQAAQVINAFLAPGPAIICYS